MKSNWTTEWSGLSPAKINLYLAVTGKRDDGFHELLSLVAQLGFGDHISLRFQGDADVLSTSHPDCPVDSSNLILKAIRAFRLAFPELPSVSAHVAKKIPMGAGLGGGSSNAATTLRILNWMTQEPLEEEELRKIAAQLGSDCPLFLSPGPCWMRGRGELLEPAGEQLKSCLHDQAVIIFKPSFAIETPWAYQKLAQSNAHTPTKEAEAAARLIELNAEYLFHTGGHNDFETPIFEKYRIYAPLFSSLRRLGVHPLLSGSGSACFCIIPKTIERNSVEAVIKAAFGENAIIAQTTLA
ncbi:MAG: 4-(cytidine 5'-diphospho)-2-C-methyl-D-erythritol kinase [Opitutales bacterium]|nr:4-(cytidine 5'-diphospho)-2-C-methyl-D-erythritol kinase [Opitutales bacterium]